MATRAEIGTGLLGLCLVLASCAREPDDQLVPAPPAHCQAVVTVSALPACEPPAPADGAARSQFAGAAEPTGSGMCVVHMHGETARFELTTSLGYAGRARCVLDGCASPWIRFTREPVVPTDAVEVELRDPGHPRGACEG